MVKIVGTQNSDTLNGNMHQSNDIHGLGGGALEVLQRAERRSERGGLARLRDDEAGIERARDLVPTGRQLLRRLATHEPEEVVVRAHGVDGARGQRPGAT